MLEILTGSIPRWKRLDRGELLITLHIPQDEHTLYSHFGCDCLCLLPRVFIYSVILCGSVLIVILCGSALITSIYYWNLHNFRSCCYVRLGEARLIISGSILGSGISFQIVISRCM